MNCPVCGQNQHRRLVSRTRTPVFQHALHATAQGAKSAASGTLAFEECRACGFVWNSAFDPDVIRYSEDYDNSQVHSEAFVEHMNSRVARILAVLPPDGPVTIVEIGCGQGDFLHRLNAAFPKGREMRAIGFDPAFRGKRNGNGEGAVGSAEIYAEYFNAESAKRLNVSPDIVVSRHTIEHVPDPVGFLTAIRSTLSADKATRIFLETPDISWILRHNAFYDFFYEHCSLFDFTSMSLALRRAKLTPTLVETCFADQYLWIEADATSETNSNADFQVDAQIDDTVENWRDRLVAVRKRGKVALWGAGAKGVTFAVVMDPDQSLIDVLVDSNPRKTGAFVALSAHPIVGPEALKALSVETVVVMNPNYEREIRETLAGLGLNPAILVIR